MSVPESEMRNSYEQAYAKMDVSVVRFRFEDFAKDVQVKRAGDREIFRKRTRPS